MTQPGYTLFDTTLGLCGVAWTADGIRAVALPETRIEQSRRRLGRTGPETQEPPPAVVAAISEMQALLNGEPRTLGGIALDLAGHCDLNLQVWRVTRAIPPGETLTYGEVARRIGKPGAARAVGRALGENPCPIIIPCHRILAAGGGTGGFSGGEGVSTKLRMLSIERARTTPEPSLFDDLPLAARPEQRPPRNA
mgnify:CR=1 FL=1